MKNTRKSGSGGRRPGAGRPKQIGDRLVVLDVAISGGDLVPRRQGISLRAAYKAIQKHGAAALISKEREADLRALGETDEAQAYLQIQETVYLGRRYEAGFDS